MRNKTEEQKKMVTTESAEKSARLIKNLIDNAKNQTDKDSKERKAVNLIGKAFSSYLDKTRQIDERYSSAVHPILKTVKSKPVIATMDNRVLVLYVLLKELTSDDAARRRILPSNDNAASKYVLPSEYKKRDLDFSVQGWPVALGETPAEQYNHKAWQKFVTVAVAAFNDAIPNADLSAWGISVAHHEPLSANTLHVASSSDAKVDTTVLNVGASGIDENDTSSTPEHVVLDTSLLFPNDSTFAVENVESLIVPQTTEFDERQVPTAVLNVGVSIIDEKDISSAPDHVVLDTSLVRPNDSTVAVEEEELLIMPQVIDFNDWQAPKALKKLIKQISEMYQYGIKLKSDAPEKSEAITALAAALFEKLKDHYESGSNLNRKSHKDFEFDFRRMLHSQDELMDAHRKYWKVVIANTALALTGIGTIAVAISLAVRGHGFFNQTKSHQMVEELNKEINNAITIK